MGIAVASIPEIWGSNPVIDKFYLPSTVLNQHWKDENKYFVLIISSKPMGGQCSKCFKSKDFTFKKRSIWFTNSTREWKPLRMLFIETNFSSECWGPWIAEWYYTRLWTLIHCTMPWAMSSSLSDNKFFFGPKHNIYTFIMILFGLFDLIILFVC